MSLLAVGVVLRPQVVGIFVVHNLDRVISCDFLAVPLSSLLFLTIPVSLPSSWLVLDLGPPVLCLDPIDCRVFLGEG